MRTACKLLPLLLTGLISACGFSLRDSDAITTRFQALELLSAQPNSEFTRLVTRSLDIANVDIVRIDALADASGLPLLALGAESLTTRPISVNPRARAAQYEMQLAVEFGVLEGETILAPNELISVTRNYFEDTSNLAGTQEELQLISREMRRELVSQLMRRLQTL